MNTYCIYKIDQHENIIKGQQEYFIPVQQVYTIALNKSVFFFVFLGKSAESFFDFSFSRF